MHSELFIWQSCTFRNKDNGKSSVFPGHPNHLALHIHWSRPRVSSGFITASLSCPCQRIWARNSATPFVQIPAIVQLLKASLRHNIPTTKYTHVRHILMYFDKFLHPCNQHDNQDTKHFPFPKTSPIAFYWGPFNFSHYCFVYFSLSIMFCMYFVEFFLVFPEIILRDILWMHFLILIRNLFIKIFFAKTLYFNTLI